MVPADTPRDIGGHVVAGFVSTTENDVRLLLYSHDVDDTQSRSDIAFEIALTLDGLSAGAHEVTEYRFDISHNSYYDLARELRQRPEPPRQQVFSEAAFDRIAERAELRPTGQSTHTTGTDGSFDLTADLAGNGVNFLIIRPAGD